jgi:hypothetical protein
VEDVPDELMDFAVFALEHAANSVVDSGGPLTPFAMTEELEAGGMNKRLTRFVCDTLEEGVEQARVHVRQTGGLSRAAVAWDGYLTMNGQRTDAVFVEAYEAGRADSVILAQRYVTGNEPERAHRLGDVALAGRGTPLF